MTDFENEDGNNRPLTVHEYETTTSLLSALKSRGKPDGDFNANNGENIMGTPSDYVLIAMIIAMMFCMTLCCLCLFCRSSNRLSICGVNFEFNERRSSVENIENQSEIHEVVPLTPTTAGDYNNRLPDIESILRGDAPPPLYNDIVKKAEAADTGKSAKDSSCKKRKSASESSSLKSGGTRSSWRISGRGIFASFRTKTAIIRGRTSDSSMQCPTVEEGVCQKSEPLPPTMEESSPGVKKMEPVTIVTVNEVTKTTSDKPAFVYDASDLNRDEDDDVFM